MALGAEFLLLFVGLPVGYRFCPVQFPPLPLLWLVAAYGLWRLLRKPGFDRGKLWNPGPLTDRLPSILGIFAIWALGVWWAVREFAPRLEWSLVRPHPVFWAVVMVAYPALSVYPQGLLYRTFFFERYQPLFPARWAMVVASASAFAFLHIIFRNWLAIGLTCAGGLLFALRYAQTRSLATSSFEHALFGCWLFTVGLGQYFFHGTVEAVSSSLRW